jgi:hypothetical protein
MLPQTTENQHRDPEFVVRPCYYVPRQEVLERVRDKTQRSWLSSFRRISSNALERTAIATVLPLAGAGDSVTLLFIDSQPVSLVMCLLANLNSMVLDYAARQKVAGANISMFVLKQLPVLPPASYREEDIAFLASRALELIYTSWDIKSFGDDVWKESEHTSQKLVEATSLRSSIENQWRDNKNATGGHEFNPPELAANAEDGIPLPPFKWDDERRAQLRAKLDAYYAHLYGLTRDELRYILDPQDFYGPDFPGETFRVLKEKEEKLYGEYRTRRLVLEAFDKLAESPRFRDEMPKRTSALNIPGDAPRAAGS